MKKQTKISFLNQHNEQQKTFCENSKLHYASKQFCQIVVRNKLHQHITCIDVKMYLDQTFKPASTAMLPNYKCVKVFKQWACPGDRLVADCVPSSVAELTNILPHLTCTRTSHKVCHCHEPLTHHEDYIYRH